MREPRSGGNPFGDRLPLGRVRPKTNGTNGTHPAGLRTRGVSLGEHERDGDPVDLVAVQADDELINALAGGLTVAAPAAGGYAADDHITSILAAWKAEVDAEPLPELVDVDRGVATVLAARPRSSRVRHLAPVAAAAAFVVLAIGGVSVGSYSAQPEDVLWPVSKVLYSERAESVEAADRVETRIARAKQAIAEGRPADAARELQAAAADLGAIRPEEGKIQLADVQDFLVAKAQETPPGVPTDPASPLVTDRARPVPVGAAIGVEPSETPPPPAVPPPPAPVAPDSGSEAPEAVLPPPAVEPAPAPAPARPPVPVAPPDTSTVPTPDPSPPDSGGGSDGGGDGGGGGTDEDTTEPSAPADDPTTSSPAVDSSETSSESMSSAPEETSTSAAPDSSSDTATPEAS